MSKWLFRGQVLVGLAIPGIHAAYLGVDPLSALTIFLGGAVTISAYYGLRVQQYQEAVNDLKYEVFQAHIAGTTLWNVIEDHDLEAEAVDRADEKSAEIKEELEWAMRDPIGHQVLSEEESQ